MRVLDRMSLLAVVPALLLAAPAAHADSLVYIKDHNVWLANENGSGQYQVTLDGTASDPYESPSQADDGTIVAIRGTGSNEMLYLMEQNGSHLVPPFKPAVEFQLGLFDAGISPDGDKIAYWTGFFGNSGCDTGSSGTTACFGNAISPSTGPGDLGFDTRVSDASWVSDTRIMTTVTGQAYLQNVGTTGGTQWFTDIDTFGSVVSFYDGEVAPTGDRLALVEDTGGQAGVVRIWRTNGDPATGTPASVPDPTLTNCGLSVPAGKFADPTWAEDGGLLAWEEDDGDPATAPTTGQGIWTVTLGSSPPPAAPSMDCSSLGTAQLVIPGGTAPDLGPAPVDPRPRGTGGGGTGGAGTGSGPGNQQQQQQQQQPQQQQQQQEQQQLTDLRAPVGTARLFGRAPRLKTALRRGIPLRVSSDEAGGVTVELLTSGRRPQRAATGNGQLAAPGQARVTARFTNRAKRRYKRARRLTLTARVVITDGAGNQTVRRLRISLKR